MTSRKEWLLKWKSRAEAFIADPIMGEQKEIIFWHGIYAERQTRLIRRIDRKIRECEPGPREKRLLHLAGMTFGEFEKQAQTLREPPTSADLFRSWIVMQAIVKKKLESVYEYAK